MSGFDLELLGCFVTEVQDALQIWERACLEINPTNVEQNLSGIFRVAHNIKGSSRSIGLDALGAFVHEVEDQITIFKNTPQLVNDEVIQKLLRVQSFLSDWVTNIPANPTHSPNTAGILADLKSPVDAKATAVSVASPGVDVIPSTKPPVSQNQTTANNAHNANETVRVKSQKLDQLIQVIGELGIQQAIVTYGFKELKTAGLGLTNALNMVTKLAKEVQSQAISLRMQELQPLFQRLERTGKEVAHSLGKKVEFRVLGSDLELDKIVMETITEPLIHIMRNAVDHGVESREARSASGKSETAIVEISATKETDSVWITLKDDGKGIDPEKVRLKAVEKGIIPANKKLTESECYDLIFMPGFSTAEKVTNVSGRGVGMDVVMQAMKSVSGRIEIESQVGKGSVFKIIIPTSLNIIDSVVVESAGERFVIPLNNILEIVDLRDNALEAAGPNTDNVLKLRDQLIPIEPLANYLKFTKSLSGVNTAKTIGPAIVSGTGRGAVAFRVDRILGQQRVIVKTISGRQTYPKQISGATVLSDGRPGLVVSLGQLAQDIFTHYQKEKLSV